MGESRYGDALANLHDWRERTGTMANTGDSQELLHWLNSLLQLNITKVEQCGTG